MGVLLLIDTRLWLLATNALTSDLDIIDRTFGNGLTVLVLLPNAKILVL